MSWWKILLLSLVALAAIGAGTFYYMYNHADLDIYRPMYADNCAGCHGDDLSGTERGGSLLEKHLRWGETVAGLSVAIKTGDPDHGMPAFKDQLTDEQIKGLSIFIAERRLGQTFEDFKYYRTFGIPADSVQTEEHSIHITTVAEGLGNMPFSIEPMPDGSFLLTEKNRGLFVLTPDGEVTHVTGTPRLGSFNQTVRGIKYGLGWLLDVALHPQYEENGWIYLHYTDICLERCGHTYFGESMNKIERGRIRDGEWVDAEVVWEVDLEFYNEFPDSASGGRLAFDDDGHLHFTVGMKGIYGSQDLDVPYGKTYRINDDGSIPADNPFRVSADGASTTDSLLAFRESIWTYGHRSPQGLEWNPLRKRAWNSEMGPRGGDELNELLPGGNYGWPYHSLGMEYSGENVERHKRRDIEFDVSQVEQTLVDITPSPAISSFVFYDGNAFGKWQDNVLIGSLKGSSLFRMVFDGNKLTHQETVVKDIGHIRDVEVGFDGMVYLLLENDEGSAIVKLEPAEDRVAVR